MDNEIKVEINIRPKTNYSKTHPITVKIGSGPNHSINLSEAETLADQLQERLATFIKQNPGTPLVEKHLDENSANWKAIPRHYHVTDLEFDVMTAIVKSEFQDGPNVIDHPVWTDCLSVKKTKPEQLSGVMSSLSKKGFVHVQFSSDGGTVALNAIGFEAFSDEAIKRNPPTPLEA